MKVNIVNIVSKFKSVSPKVPDRYVFDIYALDIYQSLALFQRVFMID